MTTQKKTTKGAVKKSVGRKHLKLDSGMNVGDAGQSMDLETGQDTSESTGPEFMYALVGSVTVLEQVRSNINTL